MNILTHTFILKLVIVVTASVFNQEDDQIDVENAAFDNSERSSLLEAEADDDWHIAHLSEDILTRRAGCKEETLQDRIKRYRKSLKEDAARIDFVSADRLPVNEKDLHARNCIPEDVDKNNTYIFDNTTKVDDINRTAVAMTIEQTSSPSEGTEKLLGSAEKTDAITPISLDETVVNKKAIEDTATKHPAMKKAKEETTKAKDGKRDDERRSNDYQFSSKEYYDDVLDFDASVCPDVVEEIVLEQDIIRNYDVECELSLQWTSLD